jgi:hypothetical protein
LPAHGFELRIQRFRQPAKDSLPATRDKQAGRRIWRWRAIGDRFEFSIYKEVIKAFAASEDKIKLPINLRFNQTTKRLCDFLLNFQSERAPDKLTKTIIGYFEIAGNRADILWLPVEIERRACLDPLVIHMTQHIYKKCTCFESLLRRFSKV